MNKQLLISAIYAITQEHEKLPPSDQQTKVVIMLSELSQRIATDWKFPQPVPWMDEMMLLNAPCS